jgi:hypothetical protein
MTTMIKMKDQTYYLRRLIVVALLLVCSILVDKAAAFQSIISVPAKTRAIRSNRRAIPLVSLTATILKAQIIDQQPLHSKSSSNDAVLSFHASMSYATKPAPLVPPRTRSKKTFIDFFASKRHRNSLLVGSGNIQVEPFQKSSRLTGSLLSTRWIKEAQLAGTRIPADTDTLIQLKLVTSFLVFTIFAIAILGVKLLPPQINENGENNGSSESL